MRRALAAFALAAAGACLRPPPPPPPPAPPPLRVPDGCLGDFSGAWVHGDDSSYVYTARDDGTALTLTAHREFPVDAGFRPRRFGRGDTGSPPGGGATAASGAATTAPAEARAGPSTAADAGGPQAAAAMDGGPARGSAADGASPGSSAADSGLERGSATDGGPPGTSAVDGGRARPDAGAALSPGVTALVVLERTPQGFVGVTTALTQHPTGRLCEARFATEVLACGDAGLVLATESATALGDACQRPASPRAAARLEHRLIRRPAPAP